jgi:hypothetical protein
MPADTNIGAGQIILGLEGVTPDTFVDIGALLDPIPEVDLSRDSLDDTNSKSNWERTKAGIRKAAPLAFKIKTTAAGYSDIKTMYDLGTEGRWSFTIPDDSVRSGGVENIVFKAWIANLKKTASLKDETFINLTLNINEVENNNEPT